MTVLNSIQVSLKVPMDTLKGIGIPMAFYVDANNAASYYARRSLTGVLLLRDTLPLVGVTRERTQLRCQHMDLSWFLQRLQLSCAWK